MRHAGGSIQVIQSRAWAFRQLVGWWKQRFSTGIHVVPDGASADLEPNETRAQRERPSSLQRSSGARWREGGSTCIIVSPSNKEETITAFPDGQINATSLFTTDDYGLLEVIGRGTNTGPLMSPMGQVPPTGRRLEQRYGIVHQFRNGKIASLHFFYDRLSLLQQLGLIGAPGQ